ncbi:MAG: hypothetical protein JWM35_571 [Verrucomicrobia bacterium]|nr:hypothetical protein [Verrucomicrobiota bacterium]
MKDPYVIAWTVLLFTSIAWYGFLVFFIGARAGKELKTLIKDLTAARAMPPPAPAPNRTTNVEH